MRGTDEWGMGMRMDGKRGVVRGGEMVDRCESVGVNMESVLYRCERNA